MLHKLGEDLNRRDADIAIRHALPDQPDLVAKRIADIEISLFAAASYLDELGPLEKPSDFAYANFIGYQTPERFVPEVAAMGFPVTKANFGITTSNGSTMYELARDGA